jgi:hypothetical protein
MLQPGPNRNKEKLLLAAIFIVIFTLATMILECRGGNLP